MLNHSYVVKSYFDVRIIVLGIFFCLIRGFLIIHKNGCKFLFKFQNFISMHFKINKKNWPPCKNLIIDNINSCTWTSKVGIIWNLYKNCSDMSLSLSQPWYKQVYLYMRESVSLISGDIWHYYYYTLLQFTSVLLTNML